MFGPNVHNEVLGHQPDWTLSFQHKLIDNHFKILKLPPDGQIS